MLSSQPLLGPTTFIPPNACRTGSSSRHMRGEIAARGGTVGVKCFRLRDNALLHDSAKGLVATSEHKHQGLQALRALHFGCFGGSSNAVEARSRDHNSSAKVPRLPRAAAQHGADQPSWWQQMTDLAAACAIASLLVAGGPCSPAEARPRLTQDEQLTIDVFKKNTPSVVYIENLALRRDQFTLDLMEKVPQGAGSGTIWDTDGHVVTNAHVIAGASDLQVSLMGDEEYPASVVGVDRDKDVAVLQLKMPEDVDMKKRLQPVTLGSSADLQVGQRVYAIGNPYGLDHTLTTGVISGTGREINSGNTGRPIENVIQTDAAINPGNSGGPLLDTSGELIGINTAIYSPSGANSGVGFAVPVDIIRSSVNQIIKFGKVLRPILGISFAPDQSVQELQQGIQGILVLDARDGSPARLAGVHGTRRDQSGRLVLGDIISAFNGKKVKSGTDLYRELDKCSIGDEVDLEILRGSEQVHLKVTLGSST